MPLSQVPREMPPGPVCAQPVNPMKSLAPSVALSGLLFTTLGVAAAVAAEGDAAQGKVFFQQSCALCHAVTLGPGGQPISGQGPSLVGVLGRKAASLTNFNYSEALRTYGVTWDSGTLDHFLTAPSAAVPGTTMPIPVPDAANRANLIAYLATLTAEGASAPSAAPVATASSGIDAGDWRNDAPGVTHRIDLSKLPAPFATGSAGNGPKEVARPEGAALSVPPGFTVKAFLTKVSGPRLLRVAPNGDIFVSETREGRVRVLRAADGADAPSANEVFASNLGGPFGIAFYPQDGNPQWVYVADMDSVVRFPYRNGDLKARGEPVTIIPHLAPHNGGGHTTRDIAFSSDGTRLFVTVGSGSNVAEGQETKNPAEIAAWEAAHGRGAAWGAETNRADVLVTDPEGKAPLRTFAVGIRNGVGLAVQPGTGILWVSTNERDGLGDDLVPDYITSVKEGAYYGWPWYYMGNHEDPRHAGERPDLAGASTVPDVPVQPHSASLQMTFYTATSGVSAFPAAYRGEIFAAFHGSWNRATRTGSKVVRVHMKDGVPTGDYEDFLTGFVVDNHRVWGRPVGVAVAHDGALLVTDDAGGVIWRVSYTGNP
jgi:glucose/arabinose dehydrogenase